MKRVYTDIPLVGEGEQFTCDACDVDLTRNVRIKCAAVGCEEVDLCPTCFCAGKEPNNHKAWHDYRVVVSKYCRVAIRVCALNLYSCFRADTRILSWLRTGGRTSK